ncbi:hypothetical protein V5799_005404 [Amblyomma americanum]|uniref:Secreted protein n=1 Tax=Amblyomma americanum TaxID=6943 RepID=A0AAQ4DZC5_AMBAM
MRALVVCLALFLALAVLHCEAKRKKRDAGNKEGGCSYEGRKIGDGKTRHLEVPCAMVTCTGGVVNVTTCDSMSNKQRKRFARQLKKKEDNEEDDTEDEKKKGFPHCCNTQD